MQTKILLPEDRIPKQWYNIIPDMPGPLAPVIHPGTMQPVSPDDLLPLFPMPLIEQEVSSQRWIDIPQQVLDIYQLWRPSPMFRAHRLEKVELPGKLLLYFLQRLGSKGIAEPLVAYLQPAKIQRCLECHRICGVLVAHFASLEAGKGHLADALFNRDFTTELRQVVIGPTNRSDTKFYVHR